MDKTAYCYNCFLDKRSDTQGRCPHCGYSTADDDGKFPLSLAQGTVLNGRYIIGRVLGQGGFGVTYIAKDWKEGNIVAIKEYFPDTMATRVDSHTVTAFSGQRGESFSYGMECFLKEAQTLAEFIGNENIVRVHSYFEENGTAYFVMDYVEGISFETYIKEHGGKISWQEAERFLLPVMDALDAVHRKGVVHRDATPDNIVITSDGVVKLLDFGAARYSLGDRSRSLDVVLKHGFAPKEQYTRHGRQGAYTDVYTIAASFYYAITGRKPVDSIDRLEDDNLVPPSNLGINIPYGVEDAILKGMEVQPNDRYQHMSEFKEALLVASPQEEIPQQNISNENIPHPNISYENMQQPDMANENGIQKSAAENISHENITQKSVISGDMPYGNMTQKSVAYGNADSQTQDNSVKKNRKWLIAAGIGGAVAVLLISVIVIKFAFPKNVSSVGSSKNTSVGGAGEGIPVSGSLNKTDDADASKTAVKYKPICNISNGGIAAEDDVYKYYAAGNIVRVNKDSGESDIVAEVNARCMNLYEDDIYYIVSGSVYRSDKEGGDSEKILEGNATVYNSMYITESGSVYLYAKNGTLYSTDVKEWKPKTVLTGIRTDDFTVEDGYIYYRSTADKMFYRVLSDGSNKEKLSSSYCFDSAVDGNTVYFNNFDSIKKISIGGGSEQVVYKNAFSGDIYGMNVAGDTIYYYVDGSSMKETICSVKTDGSGFTQVFEASDKSDKIYDINLLSDEIVISYYSAESKSLVVMAIKIADGEQKIIY